MIRTVIVIAGLASTAACATITQGSDDTVTVTTQPPGAVCEIKQGAATVAFINPTPGSMMVPKSKNDLSVVCRKEGFEPAAGTLSSEFQAMTFGNILFGGVIGVAVDAASGAMNDYPPMITLVLQPEAFRSEQERDLFFDTLRNQLDEETDAAIARIRELCKDGPGACERQVEDAQAARLRQIEEIEARRRVARVLSA
ncbi:hypothetical protein [uncultured Albimonas sp.]|uniref:hypothetical protein n=1 Tax=uncultured Albimonas sp. TaxID=1331701 RepID=UPI0030ECC34C